MSIDWSCGTWLNQKTNYESDSKKGITWYQLLSGIQSNLKSFFGVVNLGKYVLNKHRDCLK